METVVAILAQSKRAGHAQEALLTAKIYAFLRFPVASLS